LIALCLTLGDFDCSEETCRLCQHRQGRLCSGQSILSRAFGSACMMCLEERLDLVVSADAEAFEASSLLIECGGVNGQTDN